ncbi:MAG TPA: hypothetical protein VGH28_25000 [Polyangiaceae bacterium]|jgi:hypothetical protein
MKHRAAALFTLVLGALLVATAVILAACDSSPDTGDAGDDAEAPLPGLTCSKLLFCDQACTSSPCTDGCYAQATGVAQGLFDAFNACVAAQCPNGDSTCQQNAATGACGGNLSSCFADTFVGPADPDGGAKVVPDAGGSYNCGELNVCLSGCPADAGADCAAACNAKATPEAEGLLAALDSCLAIACPSTAGGPCASPGPACDGCIEQVTLAQPNTCAAPYVACNSDTSNADGGAATPTSLVDGGALTTVLTGLDQAASTIVARNGWLYFTQVIENGPVYRLWIGDGAGAFPDGGVAFGDGGATRPDGGVLLESLGPPQPTPVSLAVDDSNVYVWSVGTFDLNSSINKKDGTVVQVPLNGGPATTLATGLEVFYDSGYLNAVAVDATSVYWVAGANGNDGTIMRVPIGGGTPVALYSGQYLPQALATDGTNVYWADWGTFDSQGRSNNDGTVWQGTVNGATAIQLASNQSGPSTIAFDSSNVYWVDLGPLGAANFPALNSGTVMRAPIGGGTVTTVASSQSVPFSIAVSSSQIFWTDYGLSAPGLIMSAPANGGITVPLVSGLDDPSAITVSGSTLYWTIANSSPNNGAIMALSPF